MTPRHEETCIKSYSHFRILKKFLLNSIQALNIHQWRNETQREREKNEVKLVYIELNINLQCSVLYIVGTEAGKLSKLSNKLTA